MKAPLASVQKMREHLNSLRVEQGLTQSALGRLISRSPQWVNSHESGLYPDLKVSSLIRWCAGLGLEVVIIYKRNL